MAKEPLPPDYFGEHFPDNYSIPLNFSMNAICRSSSDAAPSQEFKLPYDVFSTSSLLSETKVVLDDSNKYLPLHYGDHHMKPVGNTISRSRVILSPYSSTIPMSAIPSSLGQTKTMTALSGYAFKEYRPLDHSSNPQAGNTRSRRKQF